MSKHVQTLAVLGTHVSYDVESAMVVTIDQEYVFGAPTRNIKERIVSKHVQTFAAAWPNFTKDRDAATTQEYNLGRWQPKAALRTS